MRRNTLIIILALSLLISVNASAFCFSEAAAMYNQSPDLLKTIAKWESGMNPYAIHWNSNGTYDYGLMQINSSWYKVLGPELWSQLGDPCTNVKVGAWILAGCIQRYGYNWDAIGSYNSRTPYKKAVYAQKISRELQKLSIKNSGGNE